VLPGTIVAQVLDCTLHTSHEMTSNITRKIDRNENGEEIEETTKMIKQPNDIDVSLPLSAPTDDERTTPSRHSALETSSSTTSNQTTEAVASDWYMEGLRRVRYVHVQRKMRYLTGMAAIGGFLFGYDTGKHRFVLVFYFPVH
jgi:hypothetical protein